MARQLTQSLLLCAPTRTRRRSRIARAISDHAARLLGQITDYLTPVQNADLLRRIHASLRPGGALAIDVPMTGAQQSEWTEIVSLLLWANSGGGTHSFEHYRWWLDEAGFGQVRQLGERWLAAVKAT